MKTTTIKLTTATKAHLDKIKTYARETYDEVIQKLINLMAESDMELSEKTKRDIKKAEEDIKAGRTYTTKQLIAELGL